MTLRSMAQQPNEPTAFDATVQSVPGDGTERRAELQRLRLPDPALAPELDAIARTAAALFEAPIARITFRDEHGACFDGAQTTAERFTGLDAAVGGLLPDDCAAVICIPDTLERPHLRSNPLVAGIRFYAAVPLVSGNGCVLGALSVFDRQPHTVGRREMETLRSLAELTMGTLERRAGAAAIHERETLQRRVREKYDDDRGAVLEMAICNEPLELQLNGIVMLLENVVAGSLGTIMFVEGSVLVGAAADPRIPAEYLSAIERMPIDPHAAACGTAVYERAPIICGDIARDSRWEAYRESALAAGLHACWSMPLFGTHGDAIGAFALHLDRASLPSSDELQLFAQTARFASLVVERHRARERLERLVFYDGLTELPNRKLFEVRFAAAVARARAVGDGIAVGVLDIDRFKIINDAYGHLVGDEVLRAIAGRLSASLREGDCIARMAGDEFLVMFPDLANQRDGIAAAQRLLDHFEDPFAVAGREIFVRPSLGLAFFPDTSRELLELLVAADKAMYAAKLRGGGVERATGAVVGGALKKLDLENDLRHALERDEFELYFQVMFDLSDGRPVGAEALLRWHHPVFGTIAPGDFIPLAEANGTIVSIGKWVIGEAARVARTWQDEGRDVFVTVNVSALQFDEPGLLPTVMDALERHGLEARRLHLELTESIIMRNPTASAAMLAQLKALGVRIVIDDFGTGYSSLAYLQQFSFDALKIDRAFVRGIADGASGRSVQIVSAVVALGVGLGVTTIAEGVEDSAQYASVRSCGCNVVQGFLCALPVPQADLDWEQMGAAPGEPAADEPDAAPEAAKALPQHC
jgi:diguanylate cyclase (GGDEF)-like protein